MCRPGPGLRLFASPGGRRHAHRRCSSPVKLHQQSVSLPTLGTVPQFEGYGPQQGRTRHQRAGLGQRAGPGGQKDAAARRVHHCQGGIGDDHKGNMVMVMYKVKGFNWATTATPWWPWL
ncbi:hypothetical protein DFAR_990008 [Desulfarculales bacterium]